MITPSLTKLHTVPDQEGTLDFFGLLTDLHLINAYGLKFLRDFDLIITLSNHFLGVILGGVRSSLGPSDVNRNLKWPAHIPPECLKFFVSKYSLEFNGPLTYGRRKG